MGWIADILKEVPLSTVLKEKLEAKDKECVSLQNDNKELKIKLQNLENELRETKLLDDKAYKIVYGCFKFEGDENLYCPGCYQTNNKKYLTNRFNSSIRVCTVCKSNISSG